MPGNDNGNGHGSRNGYHCHRCDTGVILQEGPDSFCINCGWRLSFVFGNPGHKALRLKNAIIARLIHNGYHDMNDVTPKQCREAGLVKHNS